MARLVLGCLLVAMVGVSGCGRGDHPPLYPVTGKVVFTDGTPLTLGGTVMFQSQATATADVERTLDAKGVINPDGTFELSTQDLGSGVAAGEYRALVHGAPDVEKNPDWPPPSVDPRFRRYETSGLAFTVKEGDNAFTIVVDRPTGRAGPPR